VGQGCVLVPEAIEIGALLRELAAADAIVGMKLHSVVLAAAVGTPGVMVAYHPKCLDFHASVGRLDSTIRTDQLEDRSLSELTDRLLSEHAHEASALVERVRALRESLRAHARASAWLLAQS
jgi:polysaccharide pyruvyl transferase WcaK-like protein